MSNKWRIGTRLAEFSFDENKYELSIEDRQIIIDQAITLFEHFYVHLPLKQAMHSTYPLQRLRLLRQNLAEFQSDFEFHNEVTEIFNSVRDLHTSYVLPSPFKDYVAFLPFRVEDYWENGHRRYIVTHTMKEFTHDTFRPGVTVVYWNGMPIQRAVELSAAYHAGGNKAARHSRGLQGLTIRPLIRSLLPDAHWVTVGYKYGDDKEEEVRLEWRLFKPEIDSTDPDDGSIASTAMAIDEEAELSRRASKKLYVQDVEMAEYTDGWPRLDWPEVDWPKVDWPDPGWPETGWPQVTKAVGKAVPTLEKDTIASGSFESGEISSIMPNIYSARAIPTNSGSVGYIRIRSFNPPNVYGFVVEFVRLLSALPQSGLIIDVRDNPGGIISAGELLLQLLTPNQIEPERLQFISSPFTQMLCERNAPSSTLEGLDLSPWVKSMQQAVKTGAIYSQAHPITSRTAANAIGQIYHGPVVLIVNANCYSTTDIFAAGFKDHNIGDIIGTDRNTGAGGANVWAHSLLEQLFKKNGERALDSPFHALPKNVRMRVSIRRTLRVGAQEGMPLEDIGILPDHWHQMTCNDLLNGNPDLIQRAVKILAQKDRYQLHLDVESFQSNELCIKTVTANLNRLDIYINQRPLDSIDIADGTNRFTLIPASENSVLDVHGFLDRDLAASRRLYI